MHNITLKDTQIFLAITPRGVVLEDLVFVYKKDAADFDSPYREALESLLRLDSEGLITSCKIHIDNLEAKRVDLKLNDYTVNGILKDRPYQYEFHVSPKGLKFCNDMQARLQDSLFSTPQESVICQPLVVKDSVNIVTRLTKTPQPVVYESPIPDFNLNPDSVPHSIIAMIKEWTRILEVAGVEFETTDFSKAYDSFQHLFDELVAAAYNKQDIARAVYLMEDVIDVEDDIELWERAGVDLLSTLRAYTPSARKVSTEWADHITFMTIPEPTKPGLSEVLHYMSLRFQEIDNGDYKQHNRWRGTKQTDESKFTEDELLVDELETLMANGYTVLSHIANYITEKDPRGGYTSLKVWEEFIDPQGYQKREFQIIITATKALDNLESPFTSDEFEKASNIMSNWHSSYILDKFEAYGFIKKVESEDDNQAVLYSKSNI